MAYKIFFFLSLSILPCRGGRRNKENPNSLRFYPLLISELGLPLCLASREEEKRGNLVLGGRLVGLEHLEGRRQSVLGTRLSRLIISRFSLLICSRPERFCWVGKVDLEGLRSCEVFGCFFFCDSSL